jgi:GR25 family glycosyltransferase involved in LPS biosynthesis
VKYNIISINDERAAYKENIRANVHLEEVHIPGINGFEVDLGEELEKRGIKLAHSGMFSKGEIGVWLSTFDCWQWSVDNNEELVVFEDDAIPTGTFDFQLSKLYYELPADYAFLALWIPDNQKIDYLYHVEYNDEGIPTWMGANKDASTSVFNIPGVTRLAKVYNGYGNVAQLYSPKGSQFFIDRVREVGIYTPVDCYLYQEAHSGRCAGYGPKPYWANLVKYDWPKTTVHIGDRVVLD